MIQFKRKDIITATDVSFRKIAWEYICWILAGKPDNYIIDKKNKKKA